MPRSRTGPRPSGQPGHVITGWAKPNPSTQPLTKAGFTRTGTSDRHTDDGTVPYELYVLETTT
ncbi:hypothetical protein [Streptomyces sp. NPDC059611]|uniref:hypothetical protein n=1 Tax=Streptomyces sp. NPDC059611 TaxID=3346884 RepID=UPI003677ABED